MLQNARPKTIQGFVLDPASSHALQDESCAPTHATRSAAFMLQNHRPFQGFPWSPRSHGHSIAFGATKSISANATSGIDTTLSG